jgi:hypothetical protein
MTRRLMVVRWSPEEIEKLKALIAGGVSVARAAATMNRKIHSIRVKARALGTPFSPVRIERNNGRSLWPRAKWGHGDQADCVGASNQKSGGCCGCCTSSGGASDPGGLAVQVA